MASDAVIGVWNPHGSSTTSKKAEKPPKIKLPHIGTTRRSVSDDSTATSPRLLDAREQSDLAAARLSPRPGRKLRLAIGQADRARHGSPRPVKPVSPGHNLSSSLHKAKKSFSTDSEEEVSPRGLGALPSIKVSPRDTSPTTVLDKTSTEHKNPDNVDDEKQSPNEPDLSPGYQGGISPNPPVRQRTSPRGILKSKSLDSDSDQCSVVVPSENKPNDKLRMKTPNRPLVSESSFRFDWDDDDEIFVDRFPDRIPLPDTSTIFQEALKDLNSPTRPTSRSSDPGDLHVRGSSLVTSFLDLTTLKESTESPPRVGSDSRLDMMSAAPEDNTAEEPQLTASTFLKVSNWAKRSRKISAPLKFLTVEQQPTTRARSVSPRRRAVSDVQPPRREFLEVKTDKPPSVKISDSASDSILMSTSSGTDKNYGSDVAEIARPLLSKRAMCYVMRFIESAANAVASPGSKATSTHLAPREHAVFPVISNHAGSARRARDRRDSLRLVQQLINEGTSAADTTEIASFEELRNCRYLRNVRMAPGVDNQAKKDRV